MENSTNFRLTISASVFVLAAGHMNLVQAADNTDYYQAAQPGTQGYGAPQMQQPQAGQGYGYVPTDNLTPGYTQHNYQGGKPGRNYRRGHNSSPWGGSGPGFSGPWDSGRGGNNMPWSSGRGGSGPSFSGPWDSGSGSSMPWDSGRGGNNMPWSSGRGGNGPSFSGPWDSGRGNSMPW